MRYLSILILALCAAPAIGQTITSTVPIRDKTYYPEAYRAKPDDGADDKAGIQNAINAAYTAGGGIVKLREGVWEIHPLATGYGLLAKTGVSIQGEGPGTVIRGKSSTSSAAFELVAPFGYNSATAAYGAHEMDIRDLKLECDGYLYSADNDHQYAHGLLGVVFTPRAYVANVTFGDVCYHQIELQGSRNVTVRDCTFIGQSESSRIQIDTIGGSAGQRAANVPNTYTADGVVFQNCRLAARNADGLSVPGMKTWMVELGHTSSSTMIRNVTFTDCEFGPVYDADSTLTTYYGITSDSSGPGVLSRLESVRFSGCRFLGNGVGNYTAIWLVPSTTEDPSIDGFSVDNCYFGPGTDCAGMRHGGGFLYAISLGAGTSGNSMNGGNTTSTDYSLRKNISITNNRFFPQLVPGRGAHTAGYTYVVSVTACNNAIIEGNGIYYPPNGGAVSSANTSTEVITVSTQHGLEVGDAIRFNTIASLAFEGATVTDSTTYYVSDVVSALTFKVSATLGGASVNVTTSGTANWLMYVQAGLTLSTQCGLVIGQIPNCAVRDNLIHYEHDSQTGSALFYAMLMDFSGIETLGSSVGGMVEVTGNRIMEVGAGSCHQGFRIYNGAATTTKYVKGRVEGNTVAGTWNSSTTTFSGYPWWAPSGTYTPTASAASNTTATPTVAQWQRSGDTVTVSGSVTLDATAGGAASFEMTLPLTSDLTQIYDVGGTATTGAVTENPAAISGTVTNNTVKFDWVAVDTTARVWYYQFTYQLK